MSSVVPGIATGTMDITRRYSSVQRTKNFLTGAVQQAIDQAVLFFFFLSSAFPIRDADSIVTEIL